MSGREPPARPDIGEILRPRLGDADGDSVADAAVVIGPALVVAAIGVVFVPILGQLGFLLAISILAVAAGVLSLGWRPGGSPGRARIATAIAAIVLGLGAAGFGLAANPCVAEPAMVAVVSVVLFDGTLLAAIGIGRILAQQRRLVTPVVAAGGIGLLGFYASLILVGEKVFVLC